MGTLYTLERQAKFQIVIINNKGTSLEKLERTSMLITQTPQGPIAEKGDHVRRFHTKPETDPWKWLDVNPNDANYETVQKLVALENEHANAVLEPTRPLREKIVAEIRSHTQETDVSAPVKNGEYWYFTRTFAGVDYPLLARVKSKEVPSLNVENPHPGEETILNQAKRASGKPFYNVANQTIDADKNRFIWGEDTTGGELFDLYVMDLDTKEIIDETVKQVAYSIAVVDEDIYYTRVDEAWRSFQIWVHRIGTDATEDQLVLEEPDEKFEIGVTKSRDKQWIIISAYATLSTRHWLIPADGKRHQPRMFTLPAEGLRYSIEPAGDHILIAHNQLTPDESLALVAAPSHEKFEGTSLEKPLCPSETWIEHWPLVANERLLEIHAFESFVAFGMRANGQTAIRIWKRVDGRNNSQKQAQNSNDVPLDEAQLRGIYAQPTDIAWPLEVRLLEISANPEWESDRLRFTIESFAQPIIYADYHVHRQVTDGKQTIPQIATESPEGANITIIKELKVPGFKPAEYKTRLEWVEGRDGTKIPVSMVYRADLEADGTNPGLVYGYGSYEVSLEPWFSVNRLSLLNRGVVYAMAHVRGGGELGRNWYEQGKFAEKTNTFNDFVDVSKWMISSGWVAAGRLAAQGGSAGGLLMGAIANQAPELYTVVNAQVPFVDALNTILDPSKPLTTGEWDEWGNPIEDPHIYKVMRAYTPYENVQPTTYPTIIAETSLNDIRVSYVEPLKWVQRLRDVSKVKTENPVICLIEEIAGHAGGSGRSKKWDEYSRSLAFILYKLGIQK
ncbi:prolyl oligopeptidase family serine peptidase [Gleimia sp. 6138-11-ORH1]|uniref:S9 family peptidase n=1 Tax=Gleimia sp. 6138-11-ORH1 TaxID=2973937 RepID=UPI002169EA13|nr:prolyl oligopeptidase family serine peptidase [Gleimia sp. 6138-11-ORH1]MCS4484821.1 prolyl oligopeptidase family serine peptidase [Gleimia sp. 6138-11-ORH1]